MLKVTNAAISDWERGLSTPRRDRWNDIDEAYGALGEVVRLFHDYTGIDQYRRVTRRIDRLVRSHRAVKQTLFEIGMSQGMDVGWLLEDDLDIDPLVEPE